MNSLYYGTHPFTDSVSTGFSFDEEVIKAAVRRIYEKKFNTLTEIDEGIFNETWNIFNQAVDEGFGRREYTDPDFNFYQELRYNNAVFSAFRTHRMQNDIAAQLLDENGKLKPFEQFSNDVQSITDHNVHHWLRTEYDTAVIRAHRAADWRQFEEVKDILPNLRWMPTTSATPDLIHKRYWEVKLTLPQDHPFWNKHKPGDRWNCKCHLEATDDPVHGASVIEEKDQPAPDKGLDNNPGKDARLFSDTHPYNPPSCAACTLPGKKVLFNNILSGFFNTGGKKDCYNCSRPAKLLKKTKPIKSAIAQEREKFLKEMLPLLEVKIQQIIQVKKQAVKINIGFNKYGNKHLYSDTFGRAKNILNKEDLKNLDSVLSDATFIKRVKLYKERKHDDIKRFYLFKSNINGKTVYLHVAETAYKRSSGKIDYSRFLYSITKK